MTQEPYTNNPPMPENMVARAFSRFDKTGSVILPAQWAIYSIIARETGRESILEAGCGTGSGTMLLRGKPFIFKRAEAVHRIVVGTDNDVAHVSFCQQMHPYAVWDIWDVNSGPYPAKLYDWVVAVEVLQVLPDFEVGLENMALTCRVGVWLSAPNRLAPDLATLGPPKNPYHVREFSASELVEAGRKFFSSVDVFYVSAGHLEPYQLLGEPWTGPPPPPPNRAEPTPLVYKMTL